MPTMSFKATLPEVRGIRAAARAKRLTVSEDLRRAALPVAPAPSPERLRFKPGRVVIAGAADAPRLTSEDVAGALYD
jgi:hypothetical protein